MKRERLRNRIGTDVTQTVEDSSVAKRSLTPRRAIHLQNFIRAAGEAAEEVFVSVFARTLMEICRNSEPPGLGVYQESWNQKLRIWIEPKRISAIHCAEAAAREAVKHFLANPPLINSVIGIGRSQLGKKATDRVKKRHRPLRAPWKVAAEKIILKQLKNLSEAGNAAVIELLISGLLIDAPDDGGPVVCHNTGNQIAKDRRYFESEISKIRTAIRKKRGKT